MKNFSAIVLVASIAFMAGVGTTYISMTPWVSDMANQPSIKPQERPFLPLPGSVSTSVFGEPSTVSMGSHRADAGHGGQVDHDHDPAAGSGHHHESGDTHQHGSTKAAKTGQKPQPHDHSTHSHGMAADSGHSHDSGDVHHHGGTKPSKPQGKTQRHEHGTAGHSHDHSSHSHGPANAGKSSGKHSHDNKGASGHSHDEGMGNGHDHGPAAMSMNAPAPKPIQATATSVREGKELFNIYCVVCHGSEGRGGMPMEKALKGIPEFTPQVLRRESDPHMFSMLTSGHGPMPGYAEALMPEERWHVINYLRTLQNDLAASVELNKRKGSRK